MEPLLPKESRALEEFGDLQLRDLPTEPPVRVFPEPRAVISPILLILAAIIVMSILITGLLRSIEEQNTAKVSYEAATSISCVISANQDTNVRTGPGFEYERAWILSAGQTRQVIARARNGWLQLPNGWLPRDEVVMPQREACTSLDFASNPTIFSDNIALPAAVKDLNWPELLAESFATSANQWYDTTTDRILAVDEGALMLAAGMQAHPQNAAAGDHLSDAFFTLRLEWIVIDPSARAVLRFRQSEAGAYRVEIGLDGSLRLLLQTTTGETQLLASWDGRLPTQEPFIIGILAEGEKLTVFVNGHPVMSATDTTLQTGQYSLGVEAIGAVLRLDRFEIRGVRTD